jgi:UDP-N-acetylmuramate--alanine ligase
MAEGRIIAVFQPHLYSRTRSLFDDFLDKFRLADQVLIADTYSPAGRDTPDPSFGSERLAAAVRHDTVRYSGGLKATETLLAQVAQPGDTIVVMGAGNVTDLAHRLPMVLEGVVNG